MTASLPLPAALPLEDEDLLTEILLRLPPLRSSLPHASAICTRWCRLVSDPKFFRRFRFRHRRNPPLIGFLLMEEGMCRVSFEHTLEAPNRVPTERFSMKYDDGDQIANCRHGLVLIFPRDGDQVLVWDPVTGDKHRIAVPSLLDMEETPTKGAVLRTAGVDRHFQVVLVATDGARAITYVYSSETGIWSNLLEAPLPYKPGDSLLSSETVTGLWSFLASSPVFFTSRPAVLVGDSLYWLLSNGILEFDLDRQSLAMISVREDMRVKSYTDISIMEADGGGLGVLTLSGFHAQLWKREASSDGAASWIMGRTFELDKLISLDSEKKMGRVLVAGFAEYNNMVLLCTPIGLFIVQLQSLEFKKLSETRVPLHYHPFESVYPAGKAFNSYYVVVKDLLSHSVTCMLVPSMQVSTFIQAVEMQKWAFGCNSFRSYARCGVHL
ncbi:hypothetical protein TRIUR3_20721 [Triticum urartu]|uniref:F-box domain-containing protein n=1 Tax=Triticum urartu TaxID=4572 RepID=M7ZV98_TRIUA|nr:hypothetical protein TRIUR3_20721 [Triticum urartu]